MASKNDYDEDVKRRYKQIHGVDQQYAFWMQKNGKRPDIDTPEKQASRLKVAQFRTDRQIAAHAKDAAEDAAAEERGKEARAKAKALRRGFSSGGR